MSSLLFPFLEGSAYIKPDKFNKTLYPTANEQYHLDFAKWALFNAHESKHTLWLENIARNKRFYKGDQWREKEDIDSFLRDDTGNSRNRIKIILNQIRPMVEQYRGNAIRLSIGAKAKAVSKGAKVRREEALKELLLMTDVANEFPNLGESMRIHNPEIGADQNETTDIFNNTYVDKYVKNINRLIEFSSEYNDMEEFQVAIAESMAFAGIGVIEEYRHGEHLRKEVVEAEEFFFDRNAKRKDLQDAAYMGRVHPMIAPDIYERWQGVETNERKAIESYLSANSNVTNVYGTSSTNSNTGNSVPVYKTFFMDNVDKTAGYVEDEFGQPYLVYLGEEDKFSNGKVWKEQDLIDPPENDRNKKLFKGKKKRKVVVGILRYCIFIPGEAINYNIAETGNNDPKYRDIILEWGAYDYQETNWMDLSRNRYPLKAYCWAYIDGEVLSPIDDVINPQRFMNRIMSAVEGQINNSGGAGLVYDKDMLDDSDDEAEILSNAYAGKPISIRTRGKGIPNTVGTYDNTVKGGTYQMFGLLPTIQQLMQTITGINEGLKGESTGSDQLVGVTQLMIQRGSLMQEPFYNAIARVFVQSHQATATFGKKIYMDNQRELNIIIGSEGVEVFKISKGMENEDFRVFITRSTSPEEDRQQADGTLFALLQAQLIDVKFYADLVGRSSIEEIHAKLREEVNKRLLAQKKAEEEQATASQIAGAQAQEQDAQAIQAAEVKEVENLELTAAMDERDKQHDLEKEALKGAVAQAGKADSMGAPA